MKKTQKKLNQSLLIAICFVFSNNGYTFTTENNRPTYRQTNTESFLTGQLVSLSKTEIQTSVGNYSIDKSVKVTDNRKKIQKDSFVQLGFKKNKLIKLNIY